MRSKRNILIIIGIIILIAIGLIMILKINQDKKETSNNMQNIKKNYELLSIDINKYNDIRSKYNEMSNVLIIDDYREKHENYVELLNEYNDVIKEIDNYVSNINFRCNRLYPDIDVNSICTGYKQIYEKVINLYVGDIIKYNDFITKYNEYNEEKLPLINMIHHDYIDYNNDKVYEGSIRSDND